MTIPAIVYDHFDKVFGYTEYAVIEKKRPVKSLRREAKSYFGQDFTLDDWNARQILDEIKKHNFPVFYDGAEVYTAVDPNDFMTLVAMYREEE